MRLEPSEREAGRPGAEWIDEEEGLQLSGRMSSRTLKPPPCGEEVHE